MRNSFFFLLLLFTIPLVAARQQIIYTTPVCDNISVSVTGTLPIDQNEYSLYNFDGNTSTGLWNATCDRYHHFPIILVTNDSTINTYTFTITYTYESTANTVVQHRYSGGSGGYGCYDGYEYHNGTCQRINITKPTTPPSPVVPPMVTPSPPSPVVPSAVSNIDTSVVSLNDTNETLQLVPARVVTPTNNNNGTLLVLLGTGLLLGGIVLIVVLWARRPPTGF